MNKQELIEKYEEKYANESQLDNLSISRAVLFKNVVRELKNLELDEPQKAKIPKIVAEYLEESKQKQRTFREAYLHVSGMSENTWLWKENHEERFVRAWLDGYEVEEPAWVVKRESDYYFKYFMTGKFNDCYTSKNADEAEKFTDKAKAEAVALLIDGTVEEL